MKKLLLILGLAALTTGSALADGTILPLPGIIGRVRIDCNGDGLSDRFATSADRLELHLYYGAAGLTSSDELTHFPQFAVIEDAYGRWVGLPTVLGIPGTISGESVSLQFRILTPTGILAETDIRQVSLGGEGVGTVVWQSSSQDSPFRFPYLNGPFPLPPDTCVPEPSTLALGALAGAFLLFRVRKSTNNN